MNASPAFFNTDISAEKTLTKAPPKGVTIFTKFSTLLSTFKLPNVFANFPATFFTKFVKVRAKGSRPFLISLILSRIAFKSLITGLFCSMRGEMNSAPIRPNADLILEIEPVKVSLAFLACSPNALSIASAKV